MLEDTLGSGLSADGVAEVRVMLTDTQGRRMTVTLQVLSAEGLPSPRLEQGLRVGRRRMIGLVLVGLAVVDLMLGARLMVRVCLTRERSLRLPTAWEMLLWRSFPVTRRHGLLLALPVLVLLVRFPLRVFLRTFLAREACVCGVCLYPTFFWIFSGDFLPRKRLF